MCPVITLLSTVDYCILFRQHGCAMVRADSRQLLTAKAHAVPQASSGGAGGDKLISAEVILR